ncbi:MAG: hypothetical protein IKH75_17920, partial [Ruminococcus sp.]|nr:hypothetical protein [Ruminococcus sp.]
IPKAEPLAGCRAEPCDTKRSAKGEFQNSPVDCFERGNALQERAFPDEYILFYKLNLLWYSHRRYCYCNKSTFCACICSFDLISTVLQNSP